MKIMADFLKLLTHYNIEKKVANLIKLGSLKITCLMKISIQFDRNYASNYIGTSNS